jgi:hypothetical protein
MAHDHSALHARGAPTGTGALENPVFWPFFALARHLQQLNSCDESKGSRSSLGFKYPGMAPPCAITAACVRYVASVAHVFLDSASV